MGVNRALVDSGPNAQTLAVIGSVSKVDAPSGPAFGNAVLPNTTASYLQGPFGLTNAQGAITGAAFTAECFYTPSAADIAAAADWYILDRYDTALEWALFTEAGTLYCKVKIAGTAQTVATTTIVAGTTYHLALT